MPTTYKVLGQVTGSAPATATTTMNAVIDPSFEGITQTVRISTSAGSVYQNFSSSIGTTPWRASTNFSTQIQSTTNIIEGVAALTNAGPTAFGFYNTQSSALSALGLGKTAGTSYSTNTALDSSTAIPVSGGAKYYPAFSFYKSNNQTGSHEFRIQQYNSSGTFLTQNVYAQNQGNWTTNSGVGAWFRFTDTDGITMQPTAAYATIEIYHFSDANTQYILYDAIALTPLLTNAQNFVTPVNSTTVAPFTTRFNPFYSGTPFYTPVIKSFAGTQNTLYTVPSSTQTVASTISIANLGTTAATYRIAVKPSADTLATKHWLAFDVPIGANSTDTFTVGLTMATGDSIIVQTDSSLVSFSAFGSEIS